MNEKNDCDDLSNKNKILENEVKRLVKTEKKLYAIKRNFDQEIIDLQKLNRLALAINSTYNIKNIKKIICRTMLYDFGFEKSFLFFKKKDTFYLQKNACQTNPDHIREPHLFLPESLINKLLNEKKAILVTKNNEHYNDIKNQLGLNEFIISLLNARKSRILGFLIGGISKEKALLYPELTENKANLFSNLSSLVAFALENAILIKNLKAKKIKAKFQESKINFFVNLAHEIRTPLTLIKNSFDKYTQEQNQAYFETIRQNLDKLYDDMINFLDIEKLSRGMIVYDHQKILNFSELITIKKELFIDFAANKAIKMDFNIIENIYIQADPYAISRLVNNIIDNAIKYTPINGQVMVCLQLKDKHNENVGDNSSQVTKQPVIEFIVSDTGCGIPEEERENIFNPFYKLETLKKNIQGMGVGLYIVKKIVDELNGEISITSKVNEGTTFQFRFNAYQLKSEDQLNLLDDIKAIKTYHWTKLAEEKFIEGRETIFIIEDNRDIIYNLQQQLLSKYNVYYALNGKEALIKIDTIPKPDLIISDIMMNEMDGYQLRKNLIRNENYKDIPFIFITAKTSTEDKIRAMEELEAVDFITKPFKMDDLFLKINALLKNRKLLIISTREDSLKQIRQVVFGEKNGVDHQRLKFDEKCRRYGLTDREKDVLLLKIERYPNKEIAYQLNITTKTVETHINSIYKKFGITKQSSLKKILEQ